MGFCAVGEVEITGSLCTINPKTPTIMWSYIAHHNSTMKKRSLKTDLGGGAGCTPITSVFQAEGWAHAYNLSIPEVKQKGFMS